MPVVEGSETIGSLDRRERAPGSSLVVMLWNWRFNGPCADFSAGKAGNRQMPPTNIASQAVSRRLCLRRPHPQLNSNNGEYKGSVHGAVGHLFLGPEM